MRTLGTAVENRKSNNQDEIALEKIGFESNKNELEELMENIQIELDNTDIDVIRKGEQFMEDSERIYQAKD